VSDATVSAPPTVSSAPFTTRPELAGSFGMVASTHWLASACGMAVLEAGGNAFDAAAAAGFVLQVVEPHLNGPGGDMPLLFRRGVAGEVTVLAGQGPAPGGATIDAYRELGLDAIPGSGLLAAAVPGATDAWLMLVRDHGSLPLRAILRYAIEYAEGGHPIVQPVAAAIARVRDVFVEHWPSSAAVYLDHGRAPAAGSRLRNPSLAATYRRLLDEAEAASADPAEQAEAARRAWRTGFVADAVDRFARLPAMDSSGRPHAGVLTAGDIAAWEPGYEQPVAGAFRDWTVFKTRAWGQGPVLLQQLALLDGFGARELRWGSSRLVHVVVECAKLAFADREAWYGDVSDVPLASLLGRPYNDARRGLIGEEASLELRPGSPDGRPPRLPTLPAAPVQADLRAGLGDPTLERAPERGDTCHVDVVDRHGNLVSATPSGGWLMSSPVIPELGFALGTRLQTMWLEPGLPNSLAPRRRPRTTLTPSIARRDDGRWMAFGTPGGDQQDQWQLVFLLGHVLGGLGLQEAIDAPTWHTTAFPSSFEPREIRWGEVVVESRLGAAVIRDLRRRGHRVVVSGPWSLARMSAVALDPDGLLRAAANPRGMQGYAVGR
jgi:gamma-glutamyltranspeptidase/glutathione hydrolase